MAESVPTAAAIDRSARLVAAIGIQSQLLAMNSAIDAVRSQGFGFAVDGNEVTERAGAYPAPRGAADNTTAPHRGATHRMEA
jgi:hypothetical protein